MNRKTLSRFIIVTISMLALTGCGSDDIGYIRSAVISPSGQYQAEVVEISYGATGGESVIYVENVDEGAFPLEHENNTDKSIRIEETRHGWNEQYEIEWLSDSSFTVVSGIDYKDFYLIEMDGNQYSVTDGLVIDTSKTKVLESAVSGDVMEVTTQICVKNNIDDVVCFSATSYAITEGFPLGQVTLKAAEDFETGEPLIIGPNEEKTFTIKLVGEKKSDEEFLGTYGGTVFVSIKEIGYSG